MLWRIRPSRSSYNQITHNRTSEDNIYKREEKIWGAESGLDDVWLKRVKERVLVMIQKVES